MQTAAGATKHPAGKADRFKVGAALCGVCAPGRFGDFFSGWPRKKDPIRVLLVGYR
jgi:hypothetical protein